jgi:hypothetical protein
LFPDGIGPDQMFSKHLGALQLHFSYTRSGDEGIGLVWSQVVGTLAPEDRQLLLRAFVAHAVKTYQLYWLLRVRLAPMYRTL